MPTIHPFQHSALSEPFDTTAVSTFFSTFPVRRSIFHRALLGILREITENSPLPEGLKRQWRTHHDTPMGSDLYSVAWSESPDPERLVLWMNALEAIFLYDAYASFQSTCDFHAGASLLSSTLSKEKSNSLFNMLVGQQKVIWANLFQSINRTDPERSVMLHKILSDWFKHESLAPVFTYLEDYLPFRHDNSGWTFARIAFPWLLNMSLSGTEQEAICEYEKCIGNIIVLTNDYFSYYWEKKTQPSRRLVNAIPILMQSHSLTEEEAMTFLKGTILDEEKKAKTLLSNLKKDSETAFTEDLWRYCYALQLFAGGSHLWHATTRRYFTFETANEPWRES